MDDDEIRRKLAGRDQYTGRVNALQAWEREATVADRRMFESYIRNWLLMRADGFTIGWGGFSALCRDDIPGFKIAQQALKGALSERIKRL